MSVECDGKKQNYKCTTLTVTKYKYKVQADCMSCYGA